MCRRFPGGKEALQQRLENDLQSFQKACLSGTSFDNGLRRSLLLRFHGTIQEASQDLKKIIREAAGQQEEKVKNKMARKDGDAESTLGMTAGLAASDTRMKELRDGEVSSHEEPEPDDFSEESSENDDDLFQGQFAIKDKDDAHKSAHAKRMEALPAKLAAQIGQFEPPVLESIPADVSENLDCIQSLPSS